MVLEGGGCLVASASDHSSSHIVACLRCCLTFFPRGTVVSTDCAAAQTVAVGSGNFYNDEAFKQDGVGSGNFYNNVGPESLCMGICPLLSLLGPRADRSGDSKLAVPPNRGFYARRSSLQPTLRRCMKWTRWPCDLHGFRYLDGLTRPPIHIVR